MVTTSASDTAAAARPRVPAWLIISALLLLLVLSTLLLRLWSLDRVPPYLWWDEASQGLDARDLLRGQFHVFFTRAQGKEPLYVYLTTPFVAAWDGQAFAVRLAGALLGVLMVPALYFTGRALWWRRAWVGAWAGLAAAAFWATNFWPQSINRIGFQVNAFPLVMTLALAAWLNWTHRPARRRAVTFGLLAGLAIATYLAARITPLLWVALYLALPAARRRALRTSLPWAIATLLLACAPLAVYFVLHPGDAVGRVSNFAGVYQAPSLLAQARLLLDNARLVLGGFLGYAGDPIPRHNIPDRPPFSPFVAALFGLGLLAALATLARRFWRRAPGEAVQRAWTLVIWWAVLCLPAFLSANSNPHFPRLLGALPPAFLLAGWPVAWLAGRLAPGRRSGPRPRWPRVALGAALAGLVIVEGAATAAAYFAAWAGRADLYGSYQGEMWTFVRQVAAHPGALGLAPADHSSADALEYTARGLPVWHTVVDGAGIADWLAARLSTAGGKQVLTPLWQVEPYSRADPQGALPFYLQREGTFADETFWNGFILQRFTLGPQPQFAAAGQTARLDRAFTPGLTLHAINWGAAYPNADRNASEAAAGTSLWAVLAWQAGGPLPGLRVALDLVDAAGHRLANAETPLFAEQSLDGAQTADGFWRTYHLLPVPATQPPGPVSLEVRVYHPDTLAPVLPEDATPRLSVPVGRASVAAPLTPADPSALHIERPLTAQPAAGVTLLGSDAWPGTVAPGQALALRLYWQAGPAGAADQAASLVLAPSGISTTVSLPAAVPGQVFHTFADLHLPPAMPPGPQDLVLAWPAGSTPLALGQISVAGRPRRFAAPALAQPISATFGDAVTLLGLLDRQDTRQVAAGQALTLTLAWRAQRTPPGDLARFVHMLGPDLRPVAQRDSVPCAGACPAPAWLPGEVLVDEVRIDIPHDLAPGTYPVAVGWTDAAGQRRLPARDGAGRPVPGDLLTLPLRVAVTPPLPDGEAAP